MSECSEYRFAWGYRSDEALKAIPLSARIARHYLQAFVLAKERGVSMKQAFLNLGGFDEIRSASNHRSIPVTFFDLSTTS